MSGFRLEFKNRPRERRTKLRFVSGGMCIVHGLIISAFMEEGVPCVVTSINDGNHSESSKHYEGDAIDYRTWHLPEATRDRVYQRILSRKNDDMDVVMEAKTVNGNPRWAEHIHVEIDPKRD
jgi:hypothetical protein